jgi:hypothetical protein
MADPLHALFHCRVEKARRRSAPAVFCPGGVLRQPHLPSSRRRRGSEPTQPGDSDAQAKDQGEFVGLTDSTIGVEEPLLEGIDYRLELAGVIASFSAPNLRPTISIPIKLLARR